MRIHLISTPRKCVAFSTVSLSNTPFPVLTDIPALPALQWQSQHISEVRSCLGEENDEFLSYGNSVKFKQATFKDVRSLWIVDELSRDE